MTIDGIPAARVETLHRTLTGDQVGRALELRVLRGVELLTLVVTPMETPRS